jgi:hypothetical protein
VHQKQSSTFSRVVLEQRWRNSLTDKLKTR